MEEKEKKRPAREINFNCHILICGILFWIEEYCFFQKMLLTVLSQVPEPVGYFLFVYDLYRMLHGLMLSVKRGTKNLLHTQALIHNQCFSLL